MVQVLNFLDRFLLVLTHYSISPLVNAHMYTGIVILISTLSLLAQLTLLTGHLYKPYFSD